MPTVKAYNETGKTKNHVRTFSNTLLLQPLNDAIKCKAFPQTLGEHGVRCINKKFPEIKNTRTKNPKYSRHVKNHVIL